MEHHLSQLPDLDSSAWDEDLADPPEGVLVLDEENAAHLPVLDEETYDSETNGWGPVAPPGSGRARRGSAQSAQRSAQDTHASRKEPRGSVALKGLDDKTQVDPESLLVGLNDEQRTAVIHCGEPLLIMAGAGSGKTRVLTHRIAYLLATGQARAGEILAITFTNKAAAEMRERVQELVGSQAARMWVSTFHSACVRILRREYRAAGLSSTFTIYDAQDSQRLLQMVLKANDVDSKRFGVKLIAARISDLKNELITPEQYADTAPKDPLSSVVATAYKGYQKRLEQSNALDFDDLIMRTVRLLQDNPHVAEHYHRRFRHILVDEYQDTNHAQYVLVRELVGNGTGPIAPGALTVVGDSDQSIYAFRGATIRNIEEFERDFPGARTILLEQNYRSTQNILSAANAVIARNSGRRPKNLWTASGDGAPIVVDAADSDRDEARFVVAEIDRLADEGANWGDIAVFYRMNSQSRAIEELLVRQGIPYRVVGGTRFYERREIKDALAYLQAVANPDDTVALRRVLNVPRRGIGAKAEEALAAHADQYGISFGEVLRQVWSVSGAPLGEGTGILDREGNQVIPAAAVKDRSASLGDSQEEKEALSAGAVQGLTARAAKAVANFWGLLDVCRTLDSAGGAVADILEEILDRTGYLAQLRQSEDPQDASRVENLAELHSVAQEFVTTSPQCRLVDFLERVALVADSDQVPAEEARSGQVTLMTVHTAKGLEFPTVFVTGMEDGTFPHQRSMAEPEQLAEERRLAYVAITRARQKLYLTRAAVRSAWGAPMEMPPSRFLDDIPVELLEVRRSLSSMDKARAGYGYSGSSSHAGGRGAWRRGKTREGFASRDPWGDEDGGAVIGSGTGAFLTSGAPTAKAAAEALARQGAKVDRRVAGEERTREGSAEPQVSSSAEDSPLSPGDHVLHRTLGKGVVIALEGSGPRSVAKVSFASGEKRLLVRLAPMERI